MALPTVDRADCASLPPDHSVDDHLAVERVALAADLRAAETKAGKAARGERWRLIRAAGLGIALAGTIAFGWSLVRPKDETPRMCTADGYITESGEILGRDLDQGCAWVDGDGNKVPVDENGQPTG